MNCYPKSASRRCPCISLSGIRGVSLSSRASCLPAGFVLESGPGDADLPTDISQLATDVEDKFNIDVAIEPLDRGLDGLAITRQGYSLIMVSSSIAAHRQRYAIAHELGHLVAGDHGDIIDENINFSKSPEEIRANAFAAAFLMPENALRTAFGEQPVPTEQLIADLLARYRVTGSPKSFVMWVSYR